MITIDFGAIAMPISQFKDDMNSGKEKALQVGRHYIINNILTYKRMFSKKYGNTVIAYDSMEGYWRKDVFPYYKAKRKSGREESDINWDNVFFAVNTVKEELQRYFPYRGIDVPKAEADDVIGVLALNTLEFGNHEDMMIVSSDGDNYQLLVHNHIKQYSPIQQKLISLTKEEIKHKGIVSIVKGQAGDGYPNIKSHDDHFVNEESGRQKSISSALIERFMVEGINACADDFERKNYKRNEQLYDYKYIDNDVKQRILTEFEKPLKKFDRMELMDYLIATRSRHIESVGDF